MKKLSILLLFLFSLVSAFDMLANGGQTKATFKVNGNCNMCKQKIETAAKNGGATKAYWDKTKHQITVVYPADKTTLDSIQQSIAASGYDTEKYKAKDSDYEKLHSCCKYDRE